jgi:hypothetical protein
MHRAGFEPANPSNQAAKTYALDRATTGFGNVFTLLNFNLFMLLCANNALKQKCSFARGLLCTCTSIHHSNTSVHVLTLRSFSN